MITDDRIEAIRSEAAVAGDLVMVEVCDHALSGNEDAQQLVTLALKDAAAQV